MTKNPCMVMRQAQKREVLDGLHVGRLTVCAVHSPIPSKVGPVLHHPSA
jgi:hypothetical protein